MQSYLFESLRDHTFGDLDDPIIGAVYQQNRHQGVHHYGQKRPLQPKLDEQVQLVATTSTEAATQSVLLQYTCLLYTSPSPRDRTRYRMPSSA